jgi:hypothetical protein
MPWYGDKSTFCLQLSQSHKQQRARDGCEHNTPAAAYLQPTRSLAFLRSRFAQPGSRSLLAFSNKEYLGQPASITHGQVAALIIGLMPLVACRSPLS